MAKRSIRAIHRLGESLFGVVAAAGVFAGLTQLIEAAGDEPIARVQAPRVVFTRLLADTPTEGPRPRPIPPKRLDSFPPVPGPGADTVVFTRVQAESRSRPEIGRVVTPSGPMVAGADTDLTPLVRILPEYPPNGRGGGSVLVRFDVSTLGTVENARVVESTPRGMFDEAALRAVLRWRYRPAVTDGQPVERRGLQVRLRFEPERA